MAQLPERFGKYHVLERITQGGMAEIYKVKTVGIAGFEKVLALKRILPAYAAEPRFIRSFIDEARIAVSLNHRNIVQVFDFGRAEGELYMAMELIEGVDLRSAIRDAANQGIGLPIGLACYIAGDLAACLDYAHRKRDGQRRPLNIVHCDVSPHNVMLSYEGYVKILDFGVARAAFSATPKQKRIRGKPRYMAPEQARFETPTAATDVFALAIVAWELLTGLPLFEGATIKDILRAVKRADAPAVHKLNVDVPRALSDAISRALDPNPERRGTAHDLAVALNSARRALDPAIGSRTLVRWLEELYPDAYALPPDTVENDRDEPEDEGEETGLEIPSLRMAARRMGWHEDEQTAVEQEPPAHVAELVSLVERRRVVAVSARLECDAPEARAELTRGVADLAYKHGAVLYSQSDEVVVPVFGLEVAGEDDVAHAMAFCLDAVDLVREAPGGGGVATVRLAARAGIVAQRRKTGGYQIVGDALDEAQLLAREAEPGRPLLAGGPGRLASAHYSFRELPARKPRSRRLRVLELLGPRTFDERDRALRDRRGRFVGRETELDALADAADLAIRENRRVTIVLVGDAGVGKSRLVAEFVARLPDDMGAQRPLVAVAATPGGRDAPYSLLTELFQASLNLPPGRGENARARVMHRLRYLLEPAGLGSDPVNEVLSAVDAAMELRDGFATSEHTMSGPGMGDLRDRVTAALHVFRAASVAGSLMLTVLEDIHFIDGASAAILRASMARPVTGPELLLLTARPGAEIETFRPHADQVVSVGELEPAHRDRLIRDRLRGAGDTDAIVAVARRAGGNPLFIEEIAHAVRESGTEHIPNSAREVILARVDRLSSGAKSTLQHAAVAGPEFRTRLLEELLGPRVHRELEYLCEEGLLQRADRASVEANEGELSFTHGLIQEVIYDAIAARARRETHARLGHLLASRYRAGREEPPAAIARHLEGGGEPSSAATYWLRAGDVALAAHDAAAARDAFQRAIDLDATSDGVDPTVRRNRRRAALTGLERAHSQLGDFDAQAGVLTELEELAAGDDRRLADVVNRKTVRLLRIGHYADAVTASHAAEQHALAAKDQRNLGEALRLRGEAYERSCQFDRALDAVTRSLDIFRAANAVDQETRALIGIGRIHLFASRYEDARSAYEPALDRVLHTGDPWLERAVRNNVAVIHLCLGDYTRAMQDAERSLSICRHYGDRAREGDNLAVCGTILLLVGQIDRAADYLAEALAIHDQTGSRWSRADGLVYAGCAARARGDVEAALAHLDEACSLAVDLGAPYIEANAQVARCDALLDRGADGDAQAALAAARRAVAQSREASLVGTEIEGQSRAAAALLAADEFSAALAASTEAMELLDAQKFIEGSEQAVLWMHYKLLRKCRDRSARGFLQRAYDEVMRKRELLEDPAWRASFLAIPLHAAIDAEYERTDVEAAGE